MKDDRSTIRTSIIDHVALLASASEQSDYERSVPGASVPIEMIEVFTTDLFRPKCREFVDSFSDGELKAISRLYGALCSVSECLVGKAVRSVVELQKMPEWRKVMHLAKDLCEDLRRQA